MTGDERITRLERANRRLTVAITAIFLVAGAVVTVGAVAPARVIDATGLRILDDDGQVCVSLIGGKEPMVAVGRIGSPSVMIGIDEDQAPAIVVQGQSQGSLATLLIDGNDRPRLTLQTRKRIVTLDHQGVTREAR